MDEFLTDPVLIRQKTAFDSLSTEHQNVLRQHVERVGVEARNKEMYATMDCEEIRVGKPSPPVITHDDLEFELNSVHRWCDGLNINYNDAVAWAFHLERQEPSPSRTGDARVVPQNGAVNISPAL